VSVPESVDREPIGGSAGLFRLSLTGDDLGAGQGSCRGSAKKVEGAVKEATGKELATPSRVTGQSREARGQMQVPLAV
jgi:hypothetical protein